MSSIGARRPRGGWLGALLLVMTTGCAVDLLVGGNDGSSTTASSDTGGEAGETAVFPPATDDMADSTTGSTTGLETTGGPGEGTSTGVAEDSTSTGMVESTTGELTCEGQPLEVCNDLPSCLWYPDTEDCAPNPCELEPPHECFALTYELCIDAPSCAWVGTPELGECAPLECVPCEVLELPSCMESPFCEWNEMKMFCDAIPM